MRLKLLGICSLSLFSCGMIRQKERMVKDSLFNLQVKKELNMTQESVIKTESFWEKGEEQKVIITADAPFRWQVDSGLIAESGSFQIYSQHNNKGKLALKESLENHKEVGGKVNDKVVSTIKKSNKKSEFKPKSIYILAIIIIIYAWWRKTIKFLTCLGRVF